MTLPPNLNITRGCFSARALQFPILILEIILIKSIHFDPNLSFSFVGKKFFVPDCFCSFSFPFVVFGCWDFVVFFLHEDILVLC